MRGYPPSAGTTHTCGVPLRFEMKLTHLPSGEKLGLLALPTRAMRATAAATSAFCLSGGWDWPASIPEALSAKTAVINLVNMAVSFFEDWTTGSDLGNPKHSK